MFGFLSRVSMQNEIILHIHHVRKCDGSKVHLTHELMT